MAGLFPSGPSPMAQALIGGVPRREPYPSELEFFRKNPKTTGMAAEDDKVILNPFSGLGPEEQNAVVMNESARVLMRQNPDLHPTFSLTPEQQEAFASYGPAEAQAATVAARILSGDPSALEPTPEQLEFVARLRAALIGSEARAAE